MATSRRFAFSRPSDFYSSIRWMSLSSAIFRSCDTSGILLDVLEPPQAAISPFRALHGMVTVSRILVHSHIVVTYANDRSALGTQISDSTCVTVPEASLSDPRKLTFWTCTRHTTRSYSCLPLIGFQHMSSVHEFSYHYGRRCLSPFSATRTLQPSRARRLWATAAHYHLRS